VHRAVHPGNVLLDSCGAAYLWDLGLASCYPVDNLLQMRSSTLAYLSPEQALGCVPLSGRCDVYVYSFSVLTCELLTGAQPFTAPTLADLLTQHQEERSLLLPHEISHCRLAQI
jgi:serine/threonine protein kinase